MKPITGTHVYSLVSCPRRVALDLTGDRELRRPLRDGEEFVLARGRDHEDAFVADLGDGWRFLTGSRKSIRALAEAAGFGFKFDTETREYAHGAAIYTVSPEGMVARTIPGARKASGIRCPT